MDRPLLDDWFRLSPDLLCVVGSDGQFERLSPSWEHLGYTIAELCDRPAIDVIHPDDRPRALALAVDLARGAAVRIDARVLCKDGSHRWIAWTCQRQGEGAWLVLATGRDVTEERLGRETLRLKTEELEAFFKALPDLLFRIDERGHIVGYNAGRASDLYVPPEAFLGKTFDEVLPGSVGELVTCAIERARRTGQIECIEYDLAVPSGNQRFEARVVSFHAGQCVVLVRNVTDRWAAHEALRLSEERLRESEKLEAVGRLAGGVAHDFNNLMMVVLMYSDTLLRGTSEENGKDALMKIRGAGERAARLTRQLLAFAEKQVLSPTILDVGTVVREMETTLRGLIAGDIVLALESPPDLWTVRADRSQLEQVVLNLALNARDAMTGGGRLTITLANARLDEAAAARAELAHPGDYVQLEVSDTGRGIAPDARPHIFEPFFTTKGGRPGRGLGLATVYGIVRQSGGSVTVETAPNEGALFTIFLPRAEQVGDDAIAPRPSERPRAAATVLIVDDETNVRRALVAVVKELGFQVLEASNGEAALALSATHEGPIDLLLSDLIMPGISGHDLAAQIVAARPAIRVMFMSGYAANPPPSSFAATTLQKPFQADDLIAAIWRTLERT